MFISDLRRDMSFIVRLFLRASCKPREMRPGLTRAGFSKPASPN